MHCSTAACILGNGKKTAKNHTLALTGCDKLGDTLGNQTNYSHVGQNM